MTARASDGPNPEGGAERTDGAGSRPAIGFVGLGNMGGPMARRLLAAGYRLSVWSRDPAKRDALGDAGATPCGDAAAVTAASDVVFLSVTDTAAVAEVVFGDRGIAAAGSGGKILVDTSSIEPAATREMASRLANACAMRWVDAPVSGGTLGAEGGTLVFMAGGAAADVEAVRPIIACLGQRLTHMGPIGSGQTTKVVNQMLVGGTLWVVAETLKLAADAGVAVERLPDCLAGGFADSTILQLHGRRMIEGDLAPRGRVTLMVKDMDTGCGLARAHGTAVPMAGLATELFRLLVGQGHTDVDQAGVIRLYSDRPLAE